MNRSFEQRGKQSLYLNYIVVVTYYLISQNRPKTKRNTQNKVKWCVSWSVIIDTMCKAKQILSVIGSLKESILSRNNTKPIKIISFLVLGTLCWHNNTITAVHQERYSSDPEYSTCCICLCSTAFVLIVSTAALLEAYIHGCASAHAKWVGCIIVHPNMVTPHNNQQW